MNIDGITKSRALKDFGRAHRRSEWIWANVPPARVWTYRFEDIS